MVIAIAPEVCKAAAQQPYKSGAGTNGVYTRRSDPLTALGTLATDFGRRKRPGGEMRMIEAVLFTDNLHSSFCFVLRTSEDDIARKMVEGRQML